MHIKLFTLDRNLVIWVAGLKLTGVVLCGIMQKFLSTLVAVSPYHHMSKVRLKVYAKREITTQHNNKFLKAREYTLGDASGSHRISLLMYHIVVTPFFSKKLWSYLNPYITTT